MSERDPGFLVRLLTVCLLALTCACADRLPEAQAAPSTIAVAHLGDLTLTLEDFQHYLKANLIDDEPDSTGQAGAARLAIKSRLFDAFIEERLLLQEADRRELDVSDLEVEAYLETTGSTGVAEDSEAAQAGREAARRRLKIEKLHEVAADDMPPLDEGAIPSTTRAPSGRGKRLRLRSLMLESPAVAAEVSREIRRGRITFDEAVVAHATAPEHGLPIELSWDSLSEEHRGVLQNLKRGQVSQPLDVGGGTYVFQIEAWLREGREDPDLRAEETRREMEAVRQRQASQALLSKLRKSVDIRPNFNSLPFVYIAEDSETDLTGIQ